MFVYIMAAKAKLQVGTCWSMMLPWVTVTIFLLFGAADGNTTVTDAPTTVVTTQAQVTTQTTTTTTPAPTTTPVPTSPPSPIEINTDLGPCPCDLTGQACDVDCCCDPDCSMEDKAAFSQCLPISVNVDDRLCVQKEIILTDNSPYTTEVTQGGLFCIYTDNNANRNYYNVPDIVTDLGTYLDYLNRYAGPVYIPGSVEGISYPDEYKSGNPVYVAYQSGTTGYLGLPRSSGTTACSYNNPVAFLVDESFDCVHPEATLSATTCTGTAEWKASNFINGYRVIISPHYFNWIVNGTDVTTPAPTAAPTAPTLAPTTQDVNATIDPNITTTIPTTTTTTAAPTTTTVLVTTEATSPFNNSFTIPVEVSEIICVLEDGQFTPCPFTVNNIPDPSFSTDVCSNIVLGVEFLLTYATGRPNSNLLASNELQQIIQSARVKLTLGNVKAAMLPITQKFSSQFLAPNEGNQTVRSGNPGYVVGKPVRAGVLTRQNGTQTNSYAIDESLYDLKLVKSSGAGSCLTDSQNRVQVNFGENLRSGCLFQMNLTDLNETNFCAMAQEQIINALEGLNGDGTNTNRYVATFGNTNVYSTGDWVPILRSRLPIGSKRDSYSCYLSMGMHVEVLYAKLGSLANPQPKIVGVAFVYEDPTYVTFRCIGSFCTSNNLGVFQSFEVSQSVTFIDVSQPATGYVGEPPIFLAKVPYDFFYPFLQDSSSQVYSSYVNIFLFLLCSVICANWLS